MSAATILLAVVVNIVLIAFGLRWLQRSFFYPTPSALPAAVADDVATALQRLESALRDHAPKVLDDLQPGLSENEITSIQREYRLWLTDDLKALYMWHNGSRSDAETCLIPGHHFLPLQEALQSRDEHRRQVASQTFLQRIVFEIFAGHRTGWMTVLDDRAGDGYFYDPSRARIRGSFFYHFAENSEYRYFPSFSNFLIGAADCYEKGIYRFDRDGHATEDYEQSFALWPRYASSPGTQ